MLALKFDLLDHISRLVRHCDSLTFVVKFKDIGRKYFCVVVEILADCFPELLTKFICTGGFESYNQFYPSQWYKEKHTNCTVCKRH